MPITAKFPNQVQADTTGFSLVSGSSWGVIVTSLDVLGNPRGGDTIRVYDFDINTGASVLLGSGTVNSGLKLPKKIALDSPKTADSIPQNHRDSFPTHTFASSRVPDNACVTPARSLSFIR